MGGGQRPPFKRKHCKCAQQVLLVAAAEERSCQTPRAGHYTCLNTTGRLFIWERQLVILFPGRNFQCFHITECMSHVSAHYIIAVLDITSCSKLPRHNNCNIEGFKNYNCIYLARDICGGQRTT